MECQGKLEAAKKYAEAQAAASEEKKTSKRDISAPMKRLIVTTRLKNQAKFDDSVNKNANVWELVHAQVKDEVSKSAEDALLDMAHFPDVAMTQFPMPRRDAKFLRILSRFAAVSSLFGMNQSLMTVSTPSTKISSHLRTVDSPILAQSAAAKKPPPCAKKYMHTATLKSAGTRFDGF